ncbi:serine hydrolase domain-containing protein [Saccharospirillum impatiens]|uniref:serine hydrolase domain-containing protein n=1 Tax=Saccharospirillum impatiens TaxID=169438 RepID=UPI00041BF080|nr:serine hydrolase [Saccharospirillum impatiens]
MQLTSLPARSPVHTLAAAVIVLLVSSPAHAVDMESLRAGLQAGTRPLSTLKTIHIAHRGEVIWAEAYNGASLSASTNIKSASKTLVATLVGIAIDKGLLDGVDQPIAPLLRDQLPDDPDPRLSEITIGHLLSMQAGLERTSGRNYGAWVVSDNWVRNALARPFVEEPGGDMQYSTGSTHLLSAILMRESGESTHVLANRWLAPAGVRVDSWLKDPQGIPMGGNQVGMTPESLLALGELYRRDGQTANGDQLLSQDWIDASWERRTQSRFHRGGYGYGWFIQSFSGVDGYYGWGYGGQMIYVLPELELTIAITSEENEPSGRSGYRDRLHRLVSQHIVPAVR